ncbi:MAG TPA: energy transducer TonB [Candidatus Udaeobacter sp.]|jgi:protein TonB|nr:energy transducer TonB [Candidatus Udaeobacter sp.]
MEETQVRPLIYRPPARWYIWTAFGAAMAIHLTAVALAQKREVVAVELPPQPQQIVEAVLAPPESTPPPEDIPIPEPPPPPEIKPEFVEERTPPPRPQTAQKFAPIKSPGPMSMSRAKALALYGPKPPYPYEARARHITGSGVIVVDVDSGSGSVTSASVDQSIGNPILDNAAVSTFRQWRFRPGTVSKVRIPITFTMTGASY